MTLTYNKTDLISYQASKMTAPLKQLISDYGDCLELLTAEEKLHLLAILALWQALDTELSEDSDTQDSLDCEAYRLADAIEDYPPEVSGDVLAALKCLESVEVESVLDLMVAIASQVRDGVFQQ